MIATAWRRVARRAGPLGRLGAWLGVVSLLPALAAWQFDQLRHPRSGHLLALAEQAGLLRAPVPGELAQATATTWLTVTDARCITLLADTGAVLAIAAMLLALGAERRDEDSLGVGVGVMSASMTWLVISPAAGVVVMGAAGAAILARCRRRA